MFIKHCKNAFLNILVSHLLTGLEKIQDWTKQSLQRRLHKSLSHDWIHEKTSHKFPLRQYYAQLEWKKKIRTAMGSDTVTLTSVHDLIKQLTRPEAIGGTGNTRQKAMSVMIEGRFWGILEPHKTQLD